ncbi:MAG TPA: outer membrane beta-barrel protein, partial [Chitinophagaceae bacterium]|nr:outer membrane beta-barrel protein [Chitinophagaceae bacterium]
SYGFSYANSKIDRLVYIQNINGKYEEPVDSLSNRFVFNNTQNTPGISFRWNRKKYNLSFGSSVSLNQFEQKNLTLNTITKYNFVNFIPRASYNYKIKPNENLRINYNGSTTAPSPEQLQPTRVNTDPLNVYVGNPDLKQSFRHTINGGYNFYNILKEKNMYTNLSVSMTDNAFVQSSTISDNGRRTYKTVNADGVYSINLYTDYGFKIKGTKWRTGVGPTFNLNRRIEYINGFKSINNTRAYGLNLNINQYVADKMNAYLSTEISWNDTKASVNSNANADYWQIEMYGNLNKTIKKWVIGSDLSFEARQKDPRFPQKNNFTRLNASVTRRFLKEDRLELKLQVNDIFNENRGYDRNFSSYSYTETFYNTLRRFWLLTATWNISKNGKPSKMF